MSKMFIKFSSLFLVMIIAFIIITILFGVDMKKEPVIINIKSDLMCAGLMVSTNEKSMMKDIPHVYEEIMKLKEQNRIRNIKTPWEYVSLSTNYKGSQSWDYYTGYIVDNYNELEDNQIKYTVPSGDYAVFPLKCKIKILFGIRLGMLKQYVYTKWLPQSEYEFDDYEYEYNNEEMWKKSPYDIDLYIKIRRK